MLGIGHYWRRLFGAGSHSERDRVSRIADGELEVLPAPSGVTLREGEIIHAEVEAFLRDDSDEPDQGAGILLVTNRAIVFFTDRKKWRIRWRGIDQAAIKGSGTLHVETNGGKHFSFEVSSKAEVGVLSATVDTILEMKTNDED